MDATATDRTVPETGRAEELAPMLTRARRAYFEESTQVLADAAHWHELACSRGDCVLAARSLAIQGLVWLHRGDLRGALELAVRAEAHVADADDVDARIELLALKSQLAFFTGSYADAVSQAVAGIELADGSGDDGRRLFARRAACLILGSVGVPDLRERFDETLQLAIARGERWEEAISRNDLACLLEQSEDVAGAEREIDLALSVAAGIVTEKRFLLAILRSTRADILLRAGRPADALEDAERSLALIAEIDERSPYLIGATVRAEVQAMMALGHFDDARRSGEEALDWLGDRMPRTRILILQTLAQALRAAGHVDDAFETLARASELEREAFRELSELQISLERATLQAGAARRESDSLAAKNRQLADAHAELERRTEQLEALQEQLRDQADRDWLTGLHNRRFLARQLDQLTADPLGGPVSIAVLDLDRFKEINDRYGHGTGDQVLVRVARLLAAALRATDLVVRSGGEEFVVLMPATSQRAAARCCERLREAVGTGGWEEHGLDVPVTASIGVATAAEAANLELVMRLADQRLYEAKRTGRDRVIGAGA